MHKDSRDMVPVTGTFGGNILFRCRRFLVWCTFAANVWDGSETGEDIVLQQWNCQLYTWHRDTALECIVNIRCTGFVAQCDATSGRFWSWLNVTELDNDARRHSCGFIAICITLLHFADCAVSELHMSRKNYRTVPDKRNSGMCMWMYMADALSKNQSLEEESLRINRARF